MKEPPQYIKTLRPVRASTAARLNLLCSSSSQGICFVSIGHRPRQEFKRTGSGAWFRIITRRNPAYYDLPGYQVLADATGPCVKALLLCYDRRAPWSKVSKEMRALAKREGLTGFKGGWHDCEGTDAEHWKRTKFPRFVWSRGRFVRFKG